ncbi:hypothetical protein LQW54_000343 [Pestalotiopsis sp. IQ-011]
MGALGRLRLQAALAWSLMAALSVQQEGQAGVHWIFPPPGETATFHHGDVVNVTWTSTFPTPILLPNHVPLKEVKSMDVSGYNASALVGLDFDHADGKCWFDLKPDLDGGKGSNSESFSYVSDTGDQATIGLSSSTTTTTASSTTQTSSAATTTAADAGGSAFESTRTNQPASATSSSTGATSTASADAAHLSTGAQAGLGVGIGIAGIGIGGLAIFLLLRRRRRRAPADASMQQDHYDGGIPPQSAYYGTLKGHGHGVAVYDGHPSTSPDHSLDGGAGPMVVEAPSGNAEQHGLYYHPGPQELDAPQYAVQELPATRNV